MKEYIRTNKYLPITKRSSTLFAVLLLILSLLILPGCRPLHNPGINESASASYTHIEPEEAAEMAYDGVCTVVDCRGEPDFDYERIPGAINVPIDSEDDSVEQALPDKDAEILVYCDYGGLSKKFAERLTSELGYTNVYEFNGISVWTGELEGSAHN